MNHSVGILSSLLLSAVAVSAAAPASVAASQDEEWVVVGSWNGSGGIKETEDFEVAGRMRIEWETTKASAIFVSFQVHIHSSSDAERQDSVPSEIVRGVGSGSAEYVLNTGQFYMSIESEDVDWEVRVKQGRAP